LEITVEDRQVPLSITAESLVQDVIECHPETIAVFAQHGLQCVGCYIAPYHTLTDTAREYAMNIDPLLGDLNRAIVANPA
jgi:hybrid cluster-associated redox disulfide protein